MTRQRYSTGMVWQERTESNPEVLAGKPVIRGARLAVEFVPELLMAGEVEQSLLDGYLFGA